MFLQKERFCELKQSPQSSETVLQIGEIED